MKFEKGYLADGKPQKPCFSEFGCLFVSEPRVPPRSSRDPFTFGTFAVQGETAASCRSGRMFRVFFFFSPLVLEFCCVEGPPCGVDLVRSVSSVPVSGRSCCGRWVCLLGGRAGQPIGPAARLGEDPESILEDRAASPASRGVLCGGRESLAGVWCNGWPATGQVVAGGVAASESRVFGIQPQRRLPCRGWVGRRFPSAAALFSPR